MLRPVSWTWKEKSNGSVNLGLIAQEVEKVLPELVSTDKDPQRTKGINYIGLAPVIIRAIQEQQKQIEKQNAINKNQESEIGALKSLVCRNHRRATACKSRN